METNQKYQIWKFYLQEQSYFYFMSEEILLDSIPKPALTKISGSFSVSFKEPLITFHSIGLPCKHKEVNYFLSSICFILLLII